MDQNSDYNFKHRSKLLRAPKTLMPKQGLKAYGHLYQNIFHILMNRMMGTVPLPFLGSKYIRRT